MDQLAARGREIADVIEAKANRAELLRIKAAIEPPAPTQSELVASFNATVMDHGPAFNRFESEDLERRRVEEQNAQLAAKQQRLEERRVPRVEPTQTPWWRR